MRLNDKSISSAHLQRIAPSWRVRHQDVLRAYVCGGTYSSQRTDERVSCAVLRGRNPPWRACRCCAPDNAASTAARPLRAHGVCSHPSPCLRAGARDGCHRGEAFAVLSPPLRRVELRFHLDGVVPRYGIRPPREEGDVAHCGCFGCAQPSRSQCAACTIALRTAKVFPHQSVGDVACAFAIQRLAYGTDTGPRVASIGEVTRSRHERGRRRRTMRPFVQRIGQFGVSCLRAKRLSRRRMSLSAVRAWTSGDASARRFASR